MKYFFISITVLGIICVLFSEGIPKKINTDLMMKKENSRKNEITMAEFNEAYKTWQEKNIVNYSMKIRYSAFSPVSGLWEITVNNGNVVRWKYKKTGNDEKYRNFASKLTMEHLFEMAQAAVNTKDNNNFQIFTEFDSSDGHVLYILKKAIANGKYAPTDTNFRYDVLELDFSIDVNK